LPGSPALWAGSFTFVAITEKHTEEDYEKKEKKLNFNGDREMMGAFDGIDSDLRLNIILGR
jgi:hypothetical protein